MAGSQISLMVRSFKLIVVESALLPCMLLYHSKFLEAFVWHHAPDVKVLMRKLRQDYVRFILKLC